jgi:hypothetical protein
LIYIETVKELLHQNKFTFQVTTVDVVPLSPIALCCPTLVFVIAVPVPLLPLPLTS